MPVPFSSPSRVSDPEMHHGTCVTHVQWYMPGSLTCGFILSRWRGKHFRCMRNQQFNVSGKKPIVKWPFFNRTQISVFVVLGLDVADNVYLKLSLIDGIKNLFHDAHRPGIAPLPLLTHYWSGGPASGWGGEAGSTQPHCRMPQYARLYNFGKKACINTFEIMIPYSFFHRLPLCYSISISYKTIKFTGWTQSSPQPPYMKGADKGVWYWACKLLSKQRRMVVRGGINWGEVLRPMVDAAANFGQDPQWHDTQCESAVLVMFTACAISTNKSCCSWELHITIVN